MTLAISKAVEEGAKAVVCASTGNTSASAAAYAPRAGLTCAVLIPEGYIALGKLAQALIHGARVLQVRGNFDEALRDRARAGGAGADHRRQLRQPVPHRRAEVGRVRDRRRARRRARRALHPGRQRGQHHRLLEGLPRVPGRRAFDRSSPRCSASRRKARRRSCSAIRSSIPTPSRPPSASASPHPGTARPRPRASRAVASTPSPTRRSSPPTASSPPSESVFCEPASAASVAGLLKVGVPAGATVVCTLTGHGLKDPDRAIAEIAVPSTVDADYDAIRAELGL